MSKHLSETDTDSQGMTHLHAGASYFVRREGENILGCKGNEFFNGGIIDLLLKFILFFNSSILPSRKKSRIALLGL